jgi:hypothetical protein
LSSPTLAHFLNTNRFDADTISRACIDLVETQSGGLSTGDMYADLVQHASDAEAVDQMLYQLSGDPAYTEQAALIVLSAAWNYSEAVEPIQNLLYKAAEQTETIEDNRLAQTVLYGMYLLASDSSMTLHEVSYRIDAVRDLY